jgi:phosphoribosylformylglycinamidine cyclo-ligase
MYRAFNMGVGMVLIVSPENANDIVDKTDGYIIGHLEHGEQEVRFA